MFSRQSLSDKWRWGSKMQEKETGAQARAIVSAIHEPPCIPL